MHPQEDGDLLEEEMDGLWKNVAKAASSSEDDTVERIDVDSFVQLYRSIDNLFEEDDDEEEEEEEEVAETKDTSSAATRKQGMDRDDDDDDDAELVSIFKSLANKDGVLSRQAILQWDEVQNLMTEGLLGQDEFDSLWQSTPKASKKKKGVNLQGFLTFNAGLDDLFDFDDLNDVDVDDDDEGDEDAVAAEPEAIAKADAPPTAAIINDEGLSPEALFSALVAADGFIGKDELQRWGELQEMLIEGELKPQEVESFLEEVTKDSKLPPNKLNQEQFIALYNKIEALFEEDNEDDADDDEMANTSISSKAAAATTNKNEKIKDDLLAAIDRINRDEDRLPCGLEATDKEKAFVQDLVSALELDPANIVRQKQGAIEMTDIDGEWELLYSSSAAMAYNKGLSGLGGSFPNGSFGGLKMKLTATKFMTDLEYVERINVVPDSASFDVRIDGDWDLRSSVSIFTGEPSIVLTVVPEKVTYGPTSTRADHWKSLGPTNMLDVSYLDEDLRVMRGNTSTDSILVFQRTKK